MKEGIEKLIELLNEFDKPLGWYYEDGVLDCKLNLYEYMAYEWICSARYGFIKRLVENDKIDLGEKLFNLTKNDNRKSIICDLDNNDFSWEDTFLMLLSISDTPIEDLISYLK